MNRFCNNIHLLVNYNLMFRIYIILKNGRLSMRPFFICQCIFLKQMHVFMFYKIMTEIHLQGPLSPQHGASSGCGWRNGHGVVFDLAFGRRATAPWCKKLKMLRNISQDLWLGLNLWYNMSNGEGAWDLAHGKYGACVGQDNLRQWPGN